MYFVYYKIALIYISKLLSSFLFFYLFFYFPAYSITNSNLILQFYFFYISLPDFMFPNVTILKLSTHMWIMWITL